MLRAGARPALSLWLVEVAVAHLVPRPAGSSTSGSSAVVAGSSWSPWSRSGRTWDRSSSSWSRCWPPSWAAGSYWRFDGHAALPPVPRGRPDHLRRALRHVGGGAVGGVRARSRCCAASRSERPNRVVMVVLDEFPEASLLDGQGAIDAELFPNFAALAVDVDVVPQHDHRRSVHRSRGPRDPHRSLPDRRHRRAGRGEARRATCSPCSATRTR